MRVLTLSSVYPNATLPSRGIFVHERTRRLAGGCDVVVAAPVPWFPFNRWIRGAERASVASFETRDGIAVHHPCFLSLPRYGKSLDGLGYFLSLVPFVARLRRRFPFDVVDAHFAYPDGLAATLLGKLFGAPVTVTLRGTEVPISKFRLRRPQIRIALGSADRVFAVSESLARLAVELGADPARLRLVPNGVDASRFRPAPRAAARRQLGVPEDRPLIVSVGGLTVRKGYHRVLAVLPELIGEHPDLLFAIVGGGGIEGDTGPMLRQLTGDLGLERHVRFAGPRPHAEVAAWLQAADLFCLATSNEGRPNAILEALACGVPVVATDVGGNAEIVRDGEDGLLVPFGDAAALRHALRTALGKPWDREAISAHGRGYTWEQTIEQVLGEFRDLARGPARRPAAAAAPPTGAPPGAPRGFEERR